MKTDVKMNVHIISAVIQAVHYLFWRVICFKNDILFSAQYVLRLILIDALIRCKIFFLII